MLKSNLEGDNGKSLVAFSFPDDQSQLLESKVSLSRISWQATKGYSMCKDVYTYQGWASWSGAATKGALVRFTMDPDGLCTQIRLRCGRVYVVLSENGSSPRHEGMVLGPNARVYDQTFFDCILVDNVIF